MPPELAKAPATRTHDLKCWPEYYRAVIDGVKTFEVRLNDRDYRVGDVLHLREWDRLTEQYTGRDAYREVTYVLSEGCAGVELGYVVMAHQW